MKLYYLPAFLLDTNIYIYNIQVLLKWHYSLCLVYMFQQNTTGNSYLAATNNLNNLLSDYTVHCCCGAEREVSWRLQKPPR